MEDIFNLQPDAFINPAKQKGGEIYQPSADKGKDGTYKSVVRFLPYVHNVSKSKVSKFYVWLTDPATGDGFSVDCPSTVNQKSILADTFWKLKKSQSVRDQELAQNFSRTPAYYSLVQIIKDEQEPDLEGKIMVFKFGVKINEKIESMLKPAIGEPCNPYDLFTGKLFSIKVVKKQKWNNYDMCEFVGDRCPVTLDGKPIERTQEDMDRVRHWLTEGSPDLTKYEYKEWTPEQHAKVLDVIRAIVPDMRVAEDIHAKATEGGFSASTPSATSSAPAASSATEEPKKTANSLDDLYAGL